MLSHWFTHDTTKKLFWLITNAVIATRIKIIENILSPLTGRGTDLSLTIGFKFTETIMPDYKRQDIFIEHTLIFVKKLQVRHYNAGSTTTVHTRL